MNHLYNREQFLELWLSPILIVASSVVFGFMFKRFFHSKLKKITKMSKWEGDDILLNSLESQVILWSFLFLSLIHI